MQTYQKTNSSHQLLDALLATAIGAVFGICSVYVQGWMLISVLSLVLLYAGLTSTVFKKAVKSPFSILLLLSFFASAGVILHTVPWPEMEFWSVLARIVEIIGKSHGALLIPPTLALTVLALSLRKKTTVDALSASGLRATCIGLMSAIVIGVTLKISQLTFPMSGIGYFEMHFYARLFVTVLATFAGWVGTFFVLKKLSFGQEKTELFEEVWTESAFYSSFCGFALFVLAISFVDNGLGSELRDWIIASIFDANLGDRAHYLSELALLIKSLVAVSIFAIFTPAALRCCSLLTSFLSRLANAPGGTSATDAILDAMRSKSRDLKLKEETPLKTNILRTLAWVAFCYSVIFTFIMIVPTTDAQFFLSYHNFMIKLTNTEASMHARLFMASIVALYGTGTMVVSGVVFLPNAKMPHLSVNRDGVLFPKQFLLSLIFRPYRLWADFESVTLQESKKRQLIRIEFKSGGFCTFNPARMTKEELDEFLTVIDEMSPSCLQSAEILAMRAKLQEETPQKKYGDKRQVTKIAGSNYRSTTFIPHAPGEIIESKQLRIVKKLSSKPLAAVYLVRDRRNKLAVLKQFVLPAETDENQVFKRQFHREHELLKSVRHPQIVRLQEVFEDGNSNYILLEHLEGQDLHAFVAERKKLREKVVLKWAIELCGIGSFLHGHNPPVLHRDLTPDNLIVGSDQKLKLLDFGAANQFLEGVTGTLVGKQAYVPPEQLRGKATKQSDIYSFGATMYYLLTGLEPRALAQSDVLKTGEKISPELNDLIKQCTEFDENKRPQSFDELQVRLQMIAGYTLSSETKPCENLSSETERFDTNTVTTFRVMPIRAAVSAPAAVSTVSAAAAISTTTVSTVSAAPGLQNEQTETDDDEQKSQTIKINIKNKDLVKELTK